MQGWWGVGAISQLKLGKRRGTPVRHRPDHSITEITDHTDDTNKHVWALEHKKLKNFITMELCGKTEIISAW